MASGLSLVLPQVPKRCLQPFDRIAELTDPGVAFATEQTTPLPSRVIVIDVELAAFTLATCVAARVSRTTDCAAPFLLREQSIEFIRRDAVLGFEIGTPSDGASAFWILPLPLALIHGILDAMGDSVLAVIFCRSRTLLRVSSHVGALLSREFLAVRLPPCSLLLTPFIRRPRVLVRLPVLPRVLRSFRFLLVVVHGAIIRPLSDNSSATRCHSRPSSRGRTRRPLGCIRCTAGRAG